MWKAARLGLGIVLLLGGCASSSGMGNMGGRSDLITQEQLRENSFSTLYEAVLTYRPNWLRTRGVDSFRSPTQIKVYLDNMRYGDINILQQISPISVSYVRWFDGVDASARWGLDHGAGVIYVSTTPSGQPD